MAYSNEAYNEIFTWTADTRIEYGPNTKSGKSFFRYDQYRDAKTVEEALKLGSKSVDLLWDFDRKLLKAVGGPKRDAPPSIDDAMKTFTDRTLAYMYQKRKVCQPPLKVSKEHAMDRKELQVLGQEQKSCTQDRLVAQGQCREVQTKPRENLAPVQTEVPKSMAYKNDAYSEVMTWTAGTRIEYAPNRKSGKSYFRYEKYKKAKTVEEALKLGSKSVDLLFDFETGLLKAVGGPKRVSPPQLSKNLKTLTDHTLAKMYQRWKTKQASNGVEVPEEEPDDSPDNMTLMELGKQYGKTGDLKRKAAPTTVQEPFTPQKVRKSVVTIYPSAVKGRASEDVD